MTQKDLTEQKVFQVYLWNKFSPANAQPEMFIQKIPFSFGYKIKNFSTLSMLFAGN
jgi:hypothetical protein